MTYQLARGPKRVINGWTPTQGFFDDAVAAAKKLVTPSSDTLVKLFQKQINRYAGLAIPTTIGEDGKLGPETVAATRKVASFLISQGAVTSDSFVQSGASADAAYILKNISAYQSLFMREADRRGLTGKAPPKSSAQPSLPLPPEASVTDSFMSSGIGGIDPLMLVGGALAI